MIELDGSQGEGGGQILRTGLALSMVTGQPLRIARIRAKRPKPGLMRQHLACVLAAAEVSGAQMEGAELGAETLCFTPGPVRAGDYRFSIASAGSCLLVLQTVLPALLLANAPSTLRLSGGTHNPMAPPFHFLQRAYAPLVRRMGADLQLTLRRCGFYPAGGGEVEASIHPAAAGLQPFDLLARGAPVAAFAECLSPGLARNIARRELDVMAAAMGWAGDQLRVCEQRQNEGPGNALMATLEYEQVTEVFCSLGERGVSAEEVARRLVVEARGYQASGAAVGAHLADQLALLMGLAVWQSGHGAAFTCSELTEHTRTNCSVIERFLPVRFALELEGSQLVVKAEKVSTT
ncbi:RNA 3'-terminal phosphate cyclase [Variovorax rhizosphaerae]|uniref:RNA 3'-terminal phosphate cyclase n=1 Tax=Variovorax rhizosphaerae TaxID=1836200 RepID=A0ABU8WMV9_9BURK